MDGAFEKDLDGDSPELVVVGGRIIAQQVPGTGLLHRGENGTGNLGEIGELLFEMFVFLRLGDEVDIRQGMGHLVESYVAVGRVAGDAAHEIIPGEIDTGLIYMPHERAGVESIVVVIPEDKDIVEVIELEFFQTEGQLHGS